VVDGPAVDPVLSGKFADAVTVVVTLTTRPGALFAFVRTTRA
jgi:hypothetical protein